MSDPNTPLNFWFTQSYTTFESIANGKNILEHYDTLAINECKKADIAVSYDEIAKILDNMYKLENECISKYTSRKDSGLAIPMMHPIPRPLFEHIKYVQDCLDKYTPNWYMMPIKMSKNEQINEYYLYDVEETTHWIGYDYFLKLELLLNDTNKMTYEEFLKKYNSEISFEWSKFNKHGEYFVDFHKYPQDSDEYLNAYELTKNANAKALYDLPYSHAMIFETIKYGSIKMLECPRFSNFMCEYVVRKLKNKNL